MPSHPANSTTTFWTSVQRCCIMFMEELGHDRHADEFQNR